MNPYGTPGNDIFSSNINQSANSFSDPLNISHLYPGWGVNPNYQTPSYDANYRPAYQGPNPYASYQRPGFLGALSQLYSPAYKDPYWGNPVDNNASAFNALGTRPMDAAAHVGQNYMIPLAAFAITSSKLFAGVNGVASRVTGGLTSGMMRGVGLGGVDMGMGKGLGWAAGKLGMSGVEASLVGRGAVGAFGAAMGGVLAPLALGWAASEAADAAVFQPYIRSRQMTQTIQDSFAGVTFGGSGGNPISGRGLSGRESSSMATEIDRMGIRDLTFSANQYHGIAAMGMRAGLFDDVSSGDITKRVSSIASQIKMIVAISKDPNIQSAIEEIAKLRTGGASLSGGAGSVAAGAFSSLGMYASAAGTSVQRLMGTVGAQGQYMFQMNGITPYLGQLSAATAFSGFASAQRSGLLSSAQLSRMGGIEGATQSAVAGQLTAAMTPYNRMQLANQFLGGTTGGGMMGTISSFGQLSAQDPFKLMGAMTLHGNSMLSQQFKNGGKVAENQAIDLLKSLGRSPDRNGQYDPNDVAQAMVSMGMTPDQIQAYASMRSAQTDPDVVAQTRKGFKAQEKEMLMQTIAQHGAYGGSLNAVFTPIREGFNRAIEGGADMFAYGPARFAARVGDSMASTYNSVVYGATLPDSSSEGLDMDAINRAFRGKNPKLGHTDKYSVISSLNTAARSGGPGADIARKLLGMGFEGPMSKQLFAEFLKAQGDPDSNRMYKDLSNSSKLFDDVAEMAKVGKITSKDGASVDDSAALDSITGIKADVFDSLKIIGQAAELFGGDHRLGLEIDDLLGTAKYAELAGALTGLTTQDQRVDKIRSMSEAALKGGYVASADIAAHMNIDPESVYRDPARYSSDPQVQQAIRNSGGDAARIKQIIQGEVAKKNGGSIRGTPVNARLSKDTATAQATFGQLRNDLTSRAKEDAKVAENATSLVDWKSFSGAAAKIDSGATTFLTAVTKFVDFEERRTGPLKLSIFGNNTRKTG